MLDPNRRSSISRNSGAADPPARSRATPPIRSINMASLAVPTRMLSPLERGNASVTGPLCTRTRELETINRATAAFASEVSSSR